MWNVVKAKKLKLTVGVIKSRTSRTSRTLEVHVTVDNASDFSVSHEVISLFQLPAIFLGFTSIDKLCSLIS
ncbi:hypothetical protein ACN42_g798 [Penicillium freii]|uniref:Uncharacterized protein n=1 Tax=Penicillium freii TaxID=48697 RepID=A0A101MT74_PENFR|nr:hypothetical protein ACN42_g798 [Penicillium freii]